MSLVKDFGVDVDDLVDDSEVTLEVDDNDLSDTLIVPVAVQCVLKSKMPIDVLVFSFVEASYEDGLREFLNKKMISKYIFCNIGKVDNSDLKPYLNLYLRRWIKNIILIRSRPESYEIEKDQEYRIFLKNVVENFSFFSFDLLFNLKFSTIFTKESDECLWISNTERHNFTYPKKQKVSSAKG